MYEFQGDSTDGPLYVLDEDDNIIPGGTPTGRWLLTRDLRVTNGGTLLVHGTSIGGDCDVLRIRSDGPSAFHEIRGHGGSLSFRSTKVTSWDTESGKQQTDYEDGRSYINCISEFLGDGDCSKNNMGECRMVSDTTSRDAFSRVWGVTAVAARIPEGCLGHLPVDVKQSETDCGHHASHGIAERKA